MTFDAEMLTVILAGDSELAGESEEIASIVELVPMVLFVAVVHV